MTKFDGKVHYTTTCMKHAKKNQIRINLELFMWRPGMQRDEEGKGKGARSEDPHTEL